jgi:zinc protease
MSEPQPRPHRLMNSNFARSPMTLDPSRSPAGFLKFSGALACLALFAFQQLFSPDANADTINSMAAHAVRARIAGIDVIAYPTEVKQVVTLRGSLPAGDVLSPRSNPAIATLTGAMLDKGTQRQGKFAIASRLEGVGAQLDFSVGEIMLTFSGKCLRKDLPLMISLLAEQLRMPAFSEEEFAKLKKQLSGSLQRNLERTDYRANEAFVRSIYPEGHPNHTPSTAEFINAIDAASLQQVRDFYTTWYGPDRLTLIVVGDLDAQELQSEVQHHFDGWRGGKPLPKFAKAGAASRNQEETVQMADKTNVSVIIGQTTGLQYSDPDALALRVASAVLGRGFTGRLMATVRDKEGLTYSIRSSVANDAFADGDFRINAEFNPSLLDKGISSTKRELRNWYNNGITAAELERVKKDLIGTFKVGMATTEGLADSILISVHRGYGVDWLDRYPSMIGALTLEQVNGSIRRHLNPDRMTLVKAGTVGAPKS